MPADLRPKKPFLFEFSQFLLKYKAHNALDFTDLTAFRTMRISKQILMIKRQSPIKKLTIPLGFYFKILDIKRMILWVRYTKNLKELDCTVPNYLYNIVEKASNNFLLWKTIKRTRLEILNVNSTIYAGALTNFLLKFNYVPNTVKGFLLIHALQEVDSIENIPEMSLSSLKNLNNLSLSLYPNVKAWESLLTSISNPNQLVKLNINILGKLPKDFTLSYFTLQENNQVRILQLTFMEAPKDIGNFAKSFQYGKLKH